MYDVASANRGFPMQNPNAYFSPECVTVPESTIESNLLTVLIWGDSIAQSLVPGLLSLRHNYGSSSVNIDNTVPDLKPFSLLQLTSSGCSPEWIDFYNQSIKTSEYCDYANALATDLIKDERVDIIIIAQDKYRTGDLVTLGKVASKSSKYSKLVLIVGPVPHWTTPLYNILAHKFRGQTIPKFTNLGLDLEIFSADESLSASISSTSSESNMKLLSPIKTLCNPGTFVCRTYIGKQFTNPHQLTTYDTAHFTPAGSAYLVKKAILPELISYSERMDNQKE